MSNVKVTSHAHIRFKERTDLYRKNFIANGKLAYKNGLRIKEVDDFYLKKYFFAKGKNRVKKYYKNYIYLFNKNSKNLITVIKIEDEKIIKKLEEIWIMRRKNEKDF